VGIEKSGGKEEISTTALVHSYFIFQLQHSNYVPNLLKLIAKS